MTARPAPTPPAFAGASGHAVTITHPTPGGFSSPRATPREAASASEPPAHFEAAADAILRAAGAMTTGEA